MTSETDKVASLLLRAPGMAASIAAMRPAESAALIAQYLRDRLCGVPGVIDVVSGEADHGPTITVVVDDLRGPGRRQVHNAFYAVREALQPSGLDMTVAQRDTL